MTSVGCIGISPPSISLRDREIKCLGDRQRDIRLKRIPDETSEIKLSRLKPPQYEKDCQTISPRARLVNRRVLNEAQELSHREEELCREVKDCSTLFLY